MELKIGMIGIGIYVLLFFIYVRYKLFVKVL
jgi:hypothetical protein